jgi:RNA polymerase sigma factor (sigma-70 family)
MNVMNDKELLDLFRDENSRHYAFNLIVRKYQQQVYMHIRRMLIDHDDTNDVVQDTFIKVWNNLINFKEESLLYTWIYRIATNETLSFLKKKRTKFFIPMRDVENQLISKVMDSPQLKENLVLQKLQLALLTLPEKQRLVFNMKYFDTMKYEDMSAILGTSVGALKASYHLAIKKIEKYITLD